MDKIIKRALQLPKILQSSYFIWGPRKTGKSYWLRQNYSDAVYIDLLKSDIFSEYAARPALFRERYDLLQQHEPGRLIIIDEIQRCPALLDEVHWLIENRRQHFLLTGSSARKVRRAHANLLGGRARRREMRPLCFAEVGAYDLEKVCQRGLLPPHFLSDDPLDDLRTYVSDYLREEIAQEAQVQNLPAFAEFLRVAAVTSSELLNYTNIGREVGVSAKVVRGYFQILEDTLLGFRVQPWRKSVKRRLVETEKFYLFDVGLANFLARRTPRVGSTEFGKAFEHIILMELFAWKAYRRPDTEISFWRTANRQEVDFLVDDKRVAIEVKGAARVHEGDLRHLTVLREDGPVQERIVVCLERESRTVSDRFGTVRILPWKVFLDELWSK